MKRPLDMAVKPPEQWEPMTMRRYRTVVPLHNLDTMEFSVPFQFAPNVTIEAIPDELRKDSALKRHAQYDLERLETTKNCLIFHYNAEALYSPDPNWKGEESRTIEKANVERAYLANVAFWLQHPSPLNFSLVFHMPEFDTFIIQSSERRDHLLCHPNEKDERVRPEDLEPAKAIFAALVKIPRDTSVWTALRSLIAALEMNFEELRYLILWIAIEALFGTPAEVRYRISQRLAFFIAKDRAEARSVFETAKKAYDFRSKVAHGAWKKDKDSTALTASTEVLLRRALLCLLQNDETAMPFLGVNNIREAFLDELVFKG